MTAPPLMGQPRLFVGLLLAFASVAVFAQTPANLRGQVTDPSGAAIPGASVTVTAANGDVKSAETNTNGVYTINGLGAGAYTVRISAPGFSLYERAGLEFPAGRATTLDVKLPLATAQQEITVTDTLQVEIDPAKNASATVLQGQDLEMLSDDPDDLQNDLEALAGPAAGPNGGQIFVDGFSNGQLPPKSSIREVRVNSNPFAAEFDKIGFGRIEILTKPGTDKLRGTAFVEMDNGKLDARNPYSPEKPSFLTRQFQGNLGGSLNKKTSFFFDFNDRHQDDQALVNATVLDSNFNPVSFRQNVPQPTTRLSFSPRLDYQVSNSVTLQGRYTWTKADVTNYGVGQFYLPSDATNTQRVNQSSQMTGTWVVNNTTINESRFQYTHQRFSQLGIDSQDITTFGPTISVAGAFTGGFPSVANSRDYQNNYEFQNYTTLTHGAHLLKVGVRVRGNLQDEQSDQNFNGTFNFAALTVDKCPVLSTCHAYAPTVDGLTRGLSMDTIIANGGGASQYAVVAGNPLLSIGQVDVAPFLQDDWRVIPNITVSLGLRYEIQNNIADRRALAPRVGVAWGIGGGQGRTRQPKTVLRAGFGFFYDRFAIDNVIIASRFNGINQTKYTINSPAFACVLGGLCGGQVAVTSSQPPTTYQIDPGLVALSLMQSAISIERQLPKNITVALNYTNTRGVHTLRTRNINAPLPGTYESGTPIYPLGKPDPLYQYESSGLFKQNQLTLNVNARLNSKFSLFGFYNYGHAYSNSDGVNSFPVDTYNESLDWSRAAFDIRQRLFVGGNVAVPLGIRLAPLINFQTANPYNITLGSRDLNGDTVNNDRPTFAGPASLPANVYDTIYGALNKSPLPGETLIPRNLGEGFGAFTVNLRVSRAFGFGEARSASNNAVGGGGGPGGGRGFGGGGFGGGGGGRGPGGPGGIFGAATTNRKYTLTASLEVRNLLNSVNPGTPMGVLGSPTFGQAQSIAGGGGPGGGGGFGTSQTANRRLQLQLRFTF